MGQGIESHRCAERTSQGSNSQHRDHITNNTIELRIQVLFAKLGLREILDVLICLTIVTVLCTCRAEGVRDIKNYAIIFKNGQNPCPMLQTNVPWLLPLWSSPRCRQSAGSLWSSLCTQPFPSSGIFCLRILLLTAFFPG